MHSSDTQWWLTHSADYVLGLLSDPDRLVFERIMQVEPEVQQMVVDWREKLLPLSDALTPVEPPEHILPSLITNLPAQPERTSTSDAALTKKTGPVDKATKAANAKHVVEANARAKVLADGTAFQRMLETKQKSVDGWRSYAGLATVACVLMGMLGWIGYQMFKDKTAEHRFDAISIVEDASAKPLWIVDSAREAKTLRVTAISPPEVESGKAFELWLHKPDNGGVVSLGLLPTSINASTQFNAWQFDPSAESFSVSLEPSDGSPEPVPTGPVLYKGNIQSLSF